MPSEQQYAINAPMVIEQEVDDETLIVHLEQGHYFSLRGSAQAMWNALTAGVPVTALRSLLERRYEAPVEVIAAALDGFVAELVALHLIVPATSAVHAAGASGESYSPPAKTAFVAPQLTRYTDIEDMLILDPIHEVDASGWPHRAPD